jgi:hypothetical protein
MRAVIGTAVGVLFGLGLFGCHTPTVKRPDRIDGRSLAPCPPKEKVETAAPQPQNPAPATAPGTGGN